VHEASLAQAALDLALDAARQHRAARITAIDLAIGVLAQADGESVAFWLGALAEGGPAAGARVRVIEVPAEAECEACGDKYSVTPPRWSLRCERCGGSGVLRQGRELRVASIEVE
jgi:hydrogenase nickel incorporation protein HypA/HybF